MNTASQNAPWHLWVVGIVALLFTAFGGYDYYMSQTANLEYIEAAMEPMGIDADTALEYFANFPIWMDVVWAVGVWGGVLGAILLLMRNKLAYPVWGVSLVALVISNAYGFINPIPGVTDMSASYGAVAVIFVIMLLLTLYARAMAARGVLR